MKGNSGRHNPFKADQIEAGSSPFPAGWLSNSRACPNGAKKLAPGPKSISSVRCRSNSSKHAQQGHILPMAGDVLSAKVLNMYLSIHIIYIYKLFPHRSAAAPHNIAQNGAPDSEGLKGERPLLKSPGKSLYIYQKIWGMRQIGSPLSSFSPSLLSDIMSGN